MVRFLVVAPLGFALSSVLLWATPARPCTFVAVVPDPVMPGVDGGFDVPTNALLVLQNPGTAWTATVVADDAPDDVVTVENGGVAQLDGRLSLRPGTGYTVTFDRPLGVDFDTPGDENGNRRIAFRTGAGDDVIAPATPDPVVRREEFAAEWRSPTSCDSGDRFLVEEPARTVVFVDVDLADGESGVHFDVDGDGAVSDVVSGVVADGHFGFASTGEGNEDHAFAVVDRAGNVSDPVVVNIDFARGGCSSSATAGSAAPLSPLALALLALRRRRR